MPILDRKNHDHGKMAVKFRTVTTLVVMLTACIVAAAWGQVHLPKGLEGVIPKYPGAKIVVAKDTASGSHAMMETQDNAKAVLVFYRKAVTYKGWNVMTGMALEGGATMIFTKGEQMLQITAQDSESDKTTILVNIAKQ